MNGCICAGGGEAAARFGLVSLRANMLIIASVNVRVWGNRHSQRLVNVDSFYTFFDLIGFMRHQTVY